MRHRRSIRPIQETFYSLCYELSVDSPAILSETIHQMLRRAGYNQSEKAMNAWLRVTISAPSAVGLLQYYLNQYSEWIYSALGHDLKNLSHDREVLDQLALQEARVLPQPCTHRTCVRLCRGLLCAA